MMELNMTGRQPEQAADYMAKASFSAQGRAAMLAQMGQQHYDLLVIGGGITGCGIALDAAQRGMKVALVEMQDFAAGTSSRSTKLVHGGLRYLKNLEVKMVAEVGRERAIVYENGPHVTTPEWMLLPFYKGGTFGALSTSVGLRVYDYLAGVKRGERRKMLDRSATLQREPLLREAGLKGSGVYVEYRTDDARLTIEVLKRAVASGAQAVNYAKAESFLYKNGQIVGAVIIDEVGGQTVQVRAAKVVNAAGPWVDAIREKDGSKKGKQLRLTKGVHVVIDRKRFPLKQAIYFDTPDKRMVFAIPRDGKTYVGTTDTFYAGDTAHPKMTEADRAYLIEAINGLFPQVQLTPQDIESSWAGLRPLIYEEGKDPSEISRRDEIWQAPSGLLTIAGGKLTGYRKMAELVVDKVAAQLQQESGRLFGPCGTKALAISGGDVGGAANFERYVQEQVREAIGAGLTEQQGQRIARLLGSNAPKVWKLAREGRLQAQQVGLPLDVYALLKYTVEEEMSVKPVDFFVRRTGALYFDIKWVHMHQEAVLACMQQWLGWSEAQRLRYAQELAGELRDAVVPVDAVHV